MIKKILIANRGEIALRIIRTCREMGIESVSVHSDVDEQALHVKMSDESVCIGPAKATDSYLNIHSIISAAEITGADAIHPGYGFLSENSQFAKTVRKCGLKFIGPNPEMIEIMGDKIRSKEFAKSQNVPILETIKIEDVDNKLKEKLSEVGYPLLLKASAGGGGRGMRIVQSVEELENTISTLRVESKNAFGSDVIFAEKFIANPRHIEVQILGDNHGNVIHLGERDCSVQRRYQKLIEEAPASILSESKKSEVYDYALKISKGINYNSVGTVEFLYDQDDEKFYFMEMNTRIQVEHPVTEEVTGVDLISEQIKVAMNKELALKQEDIKFTGHAIECRINAEDPINFLPRPGHIDHYHRPSGLGVRVDDYIYSGYQVSPFYDSMISKIIVRAVNRKEAITRMQRCLSEMIIGGIDTNIELHQRILDSQNFKSENYSTNLIQNIL